MKINEKTRLRVQIVFEKRSQGWIDRWGSGKFRVKEGVMGICKFLVFYVYASG